MCGNDRPPNLLKAPRGAFSETTDKLHHSIPYLCVFTALYLSIFHLIAANKKYVLVYKSESILFCIAVLIIFFGLRAYVFTDYKTYKIIFDDVPTLFDGVGDIYQYLCSNVFSSLETGYFLFNILCKTISPSYLALGNS
jgi:hypothetical protein